MNNLFDKNQKAYWKAVKDMSDFCKSNNGNPIPVDTWMEHFKNLMSNTSIDTSDDFSQFINSKVLNRTAVFNDLDYRISQEEVLKAIKKLKRGKAPSVDGILNEMLKDMSPLMVKCATKLFNGILSTGIFPETWRLNLLSTAHKKGSKFECGNYRGLAIGNNLAKVFCSILNTRLYDFAMENNLIPIQQIGFRKKCRPADHILTLKCLIDKYTKKVNGKLFVCFVDLSKAYDRVWRDGLFYKLIKCGVGGKTVDILIDMYKQVSFALKYSGKMTDYFSSDVGLKQGCVLSPLLFNLYTSDIPSLFDNGCYLVEIDNNKLSILMFADDIVLMSTEPEGLQTCIDKLHSYCSKWKLQININKSKVIVFNKSGRSYSSKYKFSIGTAVLDIVSEYCYLGIIFQPSGLFNKAYLNLYSKATKAKHMLYKMLGGQNLSVPVALHLFDSLIAPILSYGCEVIFPLSIKNLKEGEVFKVFEKLKLEQCHTSFCKFILGVPSRATNAAVKGELGSYPIAIFMFIHCIKYFNRLNTLKDMSSDSLVYKAFMESKSSNLSWFKSIQNMLHISLPTASSASNNSNLNRFYSHIVSNIKRKYVDQWFAFINRTPVNQNQGNKLRIYNKFKNSFQLEHYLKIINDRRTRVEICKLRISAHTLIILLGLS